MAAATALPVTLETRLASLREMYGDAIPVDDLADVVRGLVGSLRGDVSLQDIRVYGELEALARYIHRAKEEIQHIRPDDISDEHIPTANVELDAIVRHLEGATGNILDATENIETVAGSAPPEIADPLLDAVTSIYEACNFQDISGQRITKVIKTLETIESRIVLLVEVLGVNVEKAQDVKAIQPPRDDSHLLNGPQLPENANSQAEIDALLASFD